MLDATGKVLLTAITAAVLFAGCTVVEDYDPSAAIAAEPDGPAHIFRVRLAVETEAGEPATGVQVMAAAVGGAPVDAATDADGVATLRLRPGVAFAVDVPGLPDYAPERIDRAVAGAANETSEIVVVVYHAQIERTWTATFAGPAHVVSPYTGEPVYWLPTGPMFSADPDVEKAYLDRLGGFYAEIVWNNGPTGFGDLGIGIGTSPNEVGYVHDEGDEGPDDGRVSESMRASTQRINESDIGDADALYIGPLTREPIVAPFGLPVEVKVQAWFGQYIEEGPGPSIPVAMLVLTLLVAAVARRRA